MADEETTRQQGLRILRSRMTGLPQEMFPFLPPAETPGSQVREMDRIYGVVPPPTSGSTQPDLAQRFYAARAPDLGPSATGRAVPSPTDLALIRSLMGPYDPLAMIARAAMQRNPTLFPFLEEHADKLDKLSGM
jgi:hypothetical protein